MTELRQGIRVACVLLFSLETLCRSTFGFRAIGDLVKGNPLFFCLLCECEWQSSKSGASGVLDGHKSSLCTHLRRDCITSRSSVSWPAQDLGTPTPSSTPSSKSPP